MLAEAAGLGLGFHADGLDEAKARAAAHLCVAAGADKTLIPQWIQQGRRRRAMASRPPFSAPSYRRFGGRDG